MTKYYVAVELRDNKTNELVGYGSCSTDAETREDLQNCASIAASFIELKMNELQYCSICERETKPHMRCIC